jgi:hypothetical protein
MTRKTSPKAKTTPPNLALPTPKTAPAPRMMQVVKVTSRSKVKGERRYPYRVLGLPLDADLVKLAGAILAAFDFDEDHAYGFFDSKNPYAADTAFELFSDLEEEGGGPDAPDEVEVAMSLGMELLDTRALMAETAGFLTDRLQEQMLPLIPERLREQVRDRLSELAADLMDMPDPEDDEVSSLPAAALDMLRQPGGMDQMLSVFSSATGSQLAGPGMFGADQPKKAGVTGVPVAALFGLRPDWTFLFDYGDDWMFDVVDQGLQPAEQKKKLPYVIESLGTAPEQYPDWDDE